MNSDIKREYSSFRDPAGSIYRENGILYRRINSSYFNQYHRLMSSGLYDELIRFKALVSHEEIKKTQSEIIIKPQLIPFISYPYEWSFGELRDAALLTLKVHRRAMRHGMTLKDASAYNIQLVDGSPVLIDTLSFDFYHEGDPWGAYGQFCRHFLAPLLLMVEKDIRANKILTLFIDGIPLDMTSSLLGGKGGMFARMHISWHAKSVGRHNEDGKKSVSRTALSKKQHLALIESLIRGIEKMKLPGITTEWGDYYNHTNYSKDAGEKKADIVRRYLGLIRPNTVWDMGANDGTYSGLALKEGAQVVAFDIDPVAVERNYNAVKKTHDHMLPLILDMTAPSPGIGFANRERGTIGDRQQPDCIMALAVIHHMVISNNVTLDMLAEWFASMGRWLIIEFVPKDDSQVEILFATREDIFPDYTVEGFEAAFSKYYDIKEKQLIEGSSRILYCFKRV